jgi:hypothetical protein
MAKKRQITSKQHFVPSFYLSAFGDSGGHVRALELKTARVLKPRHHKSVGYKKFFYAVKTGVEDEISQAFETWFGSLEHQIAERLPEIIANAEAGTLRSVHFDTLAYFMAFQWIRTDAFRAFINRANESISKQVMKVISGSPNYPDYARQEAAKEGRVITDEEIAQEQRFFQQGKYRLEFDNTIHLRFITPEQLVGFHNLLLAQQWTIIRTDGPMKFVTSDNPMAVGLPKAHGIYGLSFMERTHCLPLTPQLLIETSEPDPYPEADAVDPAKTARYRTADDTEVNAYNLLNVRRARAFVYSQSAGELRTLLTEIDEEGPAMRLYINRFENYSED